MSAFDYGQQACGETLPRNIDDRVTKPSAWNRPLWKKEVHRKLGEQPWVNEADWADEVVDDSEWNSELVLPEDEFPIWTMMIEIACVPTVGGSS